MTTPITPTESNNGDDVYKRIIDSAQDPKYNHMSNYVNPDWYKSEGQKAEEARQELQDWNIKCEHLKNLETPIERYCNKILGLGPDYELTLEEYKENIDKNIEYRYELSDKDHENHLILHKKPDGMTVMEWKEKKRLIKLELKERQKDSIFEITSTPNWQVVKNIQDIRCICTAEGIRNGVTCDTCKLLVKVNDYMMNLFKDAAEGRSSIV